MSASSGLPPSQTSPSDTLNGWKEIAQHFGRSVRTVQRWERSYGLPIHRVGAARGEVLWASRAELDAWKTNRVDVPELATPPPADAPERTAPLRRWPPHGAIVLVVVVLLAALGAIARRSRAMPLVLAIADRTPRPQGVTFPLTVTGFTPDGAVTRWTRLPNGNVETLGDPIRAAADGRMAWSLSTDCATETGTHRLWMIDDSSGRRSNEVEIVVLGNPACDQPTPDLAARAVLLDRARHGQDRDDDESASRSWRSVPGCRLLAVSGSDGT